MITNQIKTLEDFQRLAQQNKAICFYLSTPECNVCKVLKPKVIEMLKDDFPQIYFCYVDLNEAKEISGQFSVFSVPTLLVYFEGKETIRVSRNIYLEELRDRVNRYYSLVF
jgi:thioredoxin 1